MIKKNPAIIVATNSPSYPYFCIMLNTIITKAPVGPPIWTLLPPRKEIKKPAIIAVCRPFSGVAPDAIARAMDRGKAIMATTTPAVMSLIICSFVNVLKSEKNLGLNKINPPLLNKDAAMIDQLCMCQENCKKKINLTKNEKFYI